jgi:hypothetical protein
MTKREFLQSCHFNNLNLRDQITASIEAIDYETTKDRDDNHVVSIEGQDGKTYYRANDELRELNENLMRDYPMFEIILLKYKSMFREPEFTLDKLYSAILQKHRSEQLDKFYGDK